MKTRIVIVEDDVLVAESLRFTLQRNGYEVTALLTDGETALNEIEINPPDLIIMDISLSGTLNGIETAATLKDRHSLPIIYLTAFTDEDTLQRARMTEPYGYLVKPFNERELIFTIDMAFYKSKAEKALRESQEQFQNMVANIPGIIYVFTVDQKGKPIIPYISDYVKRLALNPADIMADAQKLFDIVHPDDLQGLYESIERAVGQRAKWSWEGRFLVSGETVWLKGRSRPRDLVRGGMVWDGFLTDITEQKNVEDQLRESETRYRSIFDNAVEGMFQSTPEGLILKANAAMAKMFGYGSPEYLVEQNININKEHYGNPKDRQQFRATITKEGVVRNFEVELRNKEGNPTWISINARAVRDGKKNIHYYEGTAEDITYRKQTEIQIKESMEKLRKATGGIIDVIVNAVEMRDPYTAGHQKRVANLARAIATEMGLTRDQLDGVRIAGVIHDLGKISIPVEILSKPGKLSAIELKLIQTHVLTGYNILKDIDFAWPIAQMVFQHHERLDGSGYPRGLKDGEILCEAKILAVADVIEAIASHRPYRPAFGIDIALDEIEKNRGLLYYPDVVDTCLKLFREKEFKFE
jgi:PAS domain S-box-containing protein